MTPRISRGRRNNEMMSENPNTNSQPDPLFPHSAFVNINHLGLSTRSRFDCKHACLLDLAQRNVFVGVQELNVSSARALDDVFSFLDASYIFQL